jgi:[acyl-carrier-protein] S-malonyltransferase
MNKRVAYVFPGQGSQSIRMLDAWSGEPTIRHTVAEASDALGLDLWKLIESGSAETLNSTDNTQPALVAVSVALFRTWQKRVPLSPVAAAGHSVGEYSALVASGALTLADAIRVVRFRGQAMAKAVPPGSGGMAAVLGLSDAAVEQLCIDCAGDDLLQPANYNAPGQVVVAGHLAAIERIKSKAKEAGAKMVFVLPVSGPFHSALMQTAADSLSARLQALSVEQPAFDVLQNSDMRVAHQWFIKEALVAQLTRPVRWVETIRRFEQVGITHLIEIGPGEVLTNLTKRIAPAMQCMPINSPAMLESAVAAVEKSQPIAA